MREANGKVGVRSSGLAMAPAVFAWLGQTAAVDWTVLLAANAFNLLVTGVFCCRKLGYRRAEYLQGILCLLLFFPVLWAIRTNWRLGRPAWSVGLPLMLLVFLVVGFVLDYHLALDFRHSRWLWPHFLAFFAAQWSLIGYAFIVSRKWGCLTLATYLACLGSSWWAHSGRGT